MQQIVDSLSTTQDWKNKAHFFEVYFFMILSAKGSVKNLNTAPRLLMFCQQRTCYYTHIWDASLASNYPIWGNCILLSIFNAQLLWISAWDLWVAKCQNILTLRGHLQFYKAVNDIKFPYVEISLHVTLLKVYQFGGPSQSSVAVRESCGVFCLFVCFPHYNTI